MAQVKTRFVVILLVLNAALVAAGYLYFSDYWGRQVDQQRQTAQTELDAWRAKAAALANVPPAPPAIVIQTNTFNWSQVESTDYRQYIANLRAIGCPEITIKDIIMTDVMRLYAQRRGQYSVNGRPFKFWETNEKRELKQAQAEERDQQLAQINKDLPAVLRELLGINYEREMAKYFMDTDEDNRRLAFLSEDKRAKLQALRNEFDGKRELVSYYMTNGAPTPDDIEKLKKIDEEQNSALAGLLSPGELQQYELSESPTADHLRQQLIGFNPSEVEFRDMFQRQQAIDAAYAYQDLTDPSVRAAKAAEEQSMMGDVEARLSPDRAAVLEKTKDPDYQSVSLLAERYDLPPETSQTIVDMRQAAEDERKELLANTNIPQERVDAALKAIEAETEKAARQTLGDKAYAQYAQSNTWIRSLGSN
jgi:hypothetical protein